MQWDNKGAYDYTKDHTLADWGWEFIRRNENYKKEWLKVFEKFEKTPKDQVLMPFFLSEDISDYSYDPDLTHSPDLNLSNPDKIDSFILPTSDANKWGLRAYQHPDSQKLTLFNKPHIKTRFIPEPYEQDGEYIDTEQEMTFTPKSNTLVSVLDLTKPIAPQIKYLQTQASDLQEAIKESVSNVFVREKKANSQTWLLYLRCLDAVASDVKPREARSKLFTLPMHEKKESLKNSWDEHIKNARKLRDSHFTRFML